MAVDGPKFVHPGFKFVFDPATDTVETHQVIKGCDGSTRYEITHQTTASVFLGGEAEYRKCADEIRLRHARETIARLPVGKLRRAKG